ncbi:hypothetical protein [Corynebacterium lujinxingii]|uniref:Secreted protein n=1 Tax=Corynebacterium lujinxingii TaxID=2763010 RepID=A0A7H0JXQ1_9CORY|nr:hypothetical protein [Corynebacterium lujinxingii]MBC3177736.1 hypothetical protein [Corynebacterium lujinxingii]NNO10019.1 hypothetical protein [Corynebacterium lujinxingii]QNP89817.1 hypothetical protein IAU68_09020 [Corynebacterium lujinxingii]
MKRRRTLAALSAAMIAVAVLPACGNSEDEVRIAEPVLDFPQTSTTPTPTPTTTENDDEEATTSSTTTKSSSSKSTSSKTSSSKRTSTKSSSRRSSSSGGSGGSGNAVREPEPAPAREVVAQDEPGAACAWPSQGSQGSGDEYSTFCDREWARTVTPDGQDYYWTARGNGWASVDPQDTSNGVCWSREDFEGAPAQIQNAVQFCDDNAPAEDEA